MACCIFAAMIITNILFFYRKIKELLGIAVDENADMWRPTEQRAPGFRRARRMALPVLLLSGSVLYGGFHWDHLTAWARDTPACEVAQPDSDCHRHH
jgi:hypothetical protein